MHRIQIRSIDVECISNLHKASINLIHTQTDLHLIVSATLAKPDDEEPSIVLVAAASVGRFARRPWHSKKRRATAGTHLIPVNLNNGQGRS